MFTKYRQSFFSQKEEYQTKVDYIKNTKEPFHVMRRASKLEAWEELFTTPDFKEAVDLAKNAKDGQIYRYLGCYEDNVPFAVEVYNPSVNECTVKTPTAPRRKHEFN